MSEAQKLFDKLEKLPLQELLVLCATAIDTKMEKKRLDTLLLLLETKLQERRMVAMFRGDNEK